MVNHIRQKKFGKFIISNEGGLCYVKDKELF